VGNALELSRQRLLNDGMNLAKWNSQHLTRLASIL
jgi:hypothetical protein